MTKRWRITICGRVQGVFYRKSTQEKAREIGLTGWVRNLSNGCVECEAQGPEESLQELMKWMSIGPPMCEVTSLEYVEVELEDSNDFSIRY